LAFKEALTENEIELILSASFYYINLYSICAIPAQYIQYATYSN
jgi:hypothetical protein